MENIEIITWVLCSTIQLIVCILLMYAEKDKKIFSEIFGWLILGLTPISMIIVGCVLMLLLCTGIIAGIEYIGNKLFNILK